MAGGFRVGLTRTLMKPDGSHDLAAFGLDGLERAAGINWVFLDGDQPEIDPGEAARFDALIVEAANVTARSLSGVTGSPGTRADGSRLAIVARYGVGFDTVDLDACTRAGIVVTNAPDGSQRPMATVNLALILATTLKLVLKDRLVRGGRWSEWPQHLGIGLTGRTLGMIGMGRIGRETLRLAAPLEMRCLVHDPFVSAEAILEAGASPSSLDDLLRESDVVCVSVPLTQQTRGLIGAAQLGLMKPTAFLVNAARGPIVEQRALTDALSEGRIAGAGLDVFETEPLSPDDPLTGLENVVLSPHALGCTDECFILTGRSAVQSVLDVAAGRIPRFVVNPAVLDHPTLRARLASARAFLTA